MKIILSHTLGLVILFSSLVTFGQKAVLDTLPINEVVITGAKKIQSAGNVTQQIDVLTPADLKPIILGNTNITEALMYQPGMSVSVLSRNDANWGTYGGIGPKYSTYMLSGIPVDAFIDPMALDLHAVERIEIERGPASVLYPNYLSQDFAGNQSPLAGTVNMLLKSKIEEQKLMASTSYGSFNTFNGQLYFQDSYKKLNYFAGLNYEISDYTDYGTENSWLNMQDNPQYTKSKFYGGFTWFADKAEKNKLSFFFNKTFHVGDAGRVYRGFDHDYTTMNLGYSASLNQKTALNMTFGLRNYVRTWQESLFNSVDSLLSDNGVNQSILPFDLNLTYEHGKAHLLTVGADYQSASYETWSDPVAGEKQYGNKSTALQAGIYAQEELHFNGLIIRAGLRYSYVKNNIELISGRQPGTSSEDWSRLLWSGGLKYNFNRLASLFFNAGNSFMTPGLKSVGGTIKLEDEGVLGKNGQLPNPYLKPESGLGIDLGASFYLPADLRATARGFYYLIDDAIVESVVSENPSQTQSVNAGNTSSLGVEVEISQQIKDFLNWFANFTYMQSDVQNDIYEDQDGSDVPFSPEFVANAGLNFSFDFGLNVSPYMNYNSGYYDSPSNSGRTLFTPGLLMNIYISQTLIHNKTFNIELFGKFYNITNNKYEMPWQFRNTGFSAMGGLTLNFN